MGDTMVTVRDFIFLGSKITADSDCSHEIKRCLLLGRKAMTNLDRILKSRDITLPSKSLSFLYSPTLLSIHDHRKNHSEELTHWKRLWCWERLKAGGEGDDRRCDGWMASLTRWTWVGASSGSCWRTGKPGVLQSMGLQRVGCDWVTELNWTELK